MLNYHELRQQYRVIRAKKGDLRPIIAIITILLATCLISSCCMAENRPFSDKNAILAIIGEGEGESYLGKVAIAKTILNRGTLKGVYGLHSARIKKHLYSEQTYQDAKHAWEYAKSTEGEGDWDATGWGTLGDIQQFKRAGWFKRCTITAKISNHYFYACNE